MHWVRPEAWIMKMAGWARITRARVGGPALLLTGSWSMVYFGFGPIWSLRKDSIWPLVPLVSIPQGTTPDVWSSVPGLLSVGIAAAQSILLVEIVRIVWVYSRKMAILTLGYEVALLLDWFRVWAGDWYVWALYQLRLGDLCSKSGQPCFPLSGHEPWLSLAMLLLVFASALYGLGERERSSSI
jgi:hypothetical protein